MKSMEMVPKFAVWCLHLIIQICISEGILETVKRPTVSPKPECVRTVSQCVPLVHNHCMGTKLPYNYTSLALANDSLTHDDVQQKLLLWSGLRNVPKCWEVVQPLLCAIYMPRCNETANYIELPGQDLCKDTRGPCKIVEGTRGWPDFLQCHQDHFPNSCGPTKKLEFNTTGTCEHPLVATDNKNSWYQDVEGCGIQCQNPLFTAQEHQQVHIFVAVLGSMCLLCTLFTLVTFIIDWKSGSRYPALILFFINCSFFVGSVGWMAQFLPGARKDIVCRADNTMRISEPQIGSGESASCAVVFVLVYFSMISGVTWFVVLTYAWHLIFKHLGTPHDAMEGKKGHFHLVAWSIPLVLTIVCLALTQIDGDSVSGICFVGYLEHAYRGGFVLFPIGVVIIVGLSFLVKGLVTLIRIKLQSPGVISDKASAKIRETIIRLGIFASFALLFVIITFCVHLYIFQNEPHWQRSFQDFVICEANVTIARSLSNKSVTCQLESRPSLIAMEIHIFAYFGAGIVMSSWVWNRSTLDAWKRLFKRVFRLPDNKPVKLKKHQIIAQAFSKRQEMNHGRLSLSFHSTHDDPLGMKFDLNSVSSHEMSSAWAAAIPRMIMRRGGMVHPTATNSRRQSDSDFESVQSTNKKVDGESRRMSMESHGSHASQHSQGSDDSGSRRRKRRKRRMRACSRVALSATPTSQGTSANMGSLDHVTSLSDSFRRGSITNSDFGSNASTCGVNGSLERPRKPADDANDNNIETIELPEKDFSQPASEDMDMAHVTALHKQSSSTYTMFTASGFLPGAAPQKDHCKRDNPIPRPHPNVPKSKPHQAWAPEEQKKTAKLGLPMGRAVRKKFRKRRTKVKPHHLETPIDAVVQIEMEQSDSSTE